jgi:hypothetical protein
MSTLVLRSQQLADLDQDSAIDGTQWNALISEWYGEAYEIIAAEGQRYFEFVTTLTTDGTNYLPEPIDQLAIVDQLELILNPTTGLARRLHPITPQQRSRLTGQTGPPRYYELVDGRYFLYPTPPANQQLTLRYIGQCPDLTGYGGAQVVDCYCVAGQKFVQYGAAAAALQKFKMDASHLLLERESQRKLLWEWAADRAMNAQPVWYAEDGEDDAYLPSNWSW